MSNATNRDFLFEENVELRKRLRILLASTSWRVMAPLRRVASLVRGKRHVEPGFLAPAKSSEMPSKFEMLSKRGINHRRINVGCGYDKKPGYLNVDSDPACNPDLLLHDNEYTGLPRNHFEEVYANDVLEHIPRAQSLSALLEWADLLAVGGRLVLQTSSILGVANKLATTTTYADHHGWTICLFGNQAHSGDFHHTGFTDITLRVLLLAAGFRVDAIGVRDHWLLWANAVKIERWTEVLSETVDCTDADFVVAAYQYAFARNPEPGVPQDHAANIAQGHCTRRDVLKHLMSAPERLFYTARRHGH